MSLNLFTYNLEVSALHNCKSGADRRKHATSVCEKYIPAYNNNQPIDVLILQYRLLTESINAQTLSQPLPNYVFARRDRLETLITRELFKQPGTTYELYLHIFEFTTELIYWPNYRLNPYTQMTNFMTTIGSNPDPHKHHFDLRPDAFDQETTPNALVNYVIITTVHERLQKLNPITYTVHDNYVAANNPQANYQAYSDLQDRIDERTIILNQLKQGHTNGST